jgi:glycosyltransferase involved in cell wall biosynthesis
MIFEFKWLGLLFLSLGSLTIVFPLLAAIVKVFSERDSKLGPVNRPIRSIRPIKIDILIPAFNEADTIEQTLRSIFSSCRFLSARHPHFVTKIVLALDGSSDETGSIARGLLISVPMEIRERSVNLGKWKTLSELVAQSEGDWSALVDSGTLWPEDFLVGIATKLESSTSVGIAPGYRQQSGGVLSRLIWWQERFLKSLENWAGGPISLHGASMIFRTKELKRCIQELGDLAWLNDDLVIALTARKMGSIDYLGDSLLVSDCGVRKGVSEWGRRNRIARGNIQWIGDLFIPNLFRLTPVLILLGLRRVMRVLWAYHLIFSVFCFGMLFGVSWEFSLGLTALLVSLAATSRSLRQAGWVSLSVPYLILRKDGSPAWS